MARRVPLAARVLLVALLAGAALMAPTHEAVAGKIDRLESVERDHYRALKVWIPEKDRKRYLRLKTREERDQWLKDEGYWERFYQYDPPVRTKILEGDVKIGWTEDMILMAWGPAHNRRRELLRDAQRAETLIFRFEVSPEGKVLIWAPDSTTHHNAAKLFRYELLVADGALRSMTRKDGWD